MPLRVLMFGWELPPYNSGGLGVACQGLITALAAQGVEVTFVLPKKLPLTQPGIRIIFADLPGVNLTRYSVYSGSVKSSSGNILLPDDLAKAVQLYANFAGYITKKIPHDLVHVHDWLCFPAGETSQEVSGKPLVCQVHATEIDRSGSKNPNRKIYDIEQKTMTKAAKIIAVSNFTKNLLTKYYATPGDKIAVVHNGINPEEYSQNIQTQPVLVPLKQAGYKIVTYVGRLTMQKGVDYLIKAAGLILKTREDIVFLIIGSGDQEANLISEVAVRGISDHVLFAGWLRGELLKQVFKSSDLFVMPSVSEPFGLTALESVALGTPALISKQSGVAEALTHVLKVDFWDIHDMAEKIVSVLDYSSLKNTLVINGSPESAKNTWKKAAAKTIDVYRRILQQSS